MLTRAIVVSTPSLGSNTYRVRIPYLEDNTQTKAMFSAILCNQPGEYTLYAVGDAVYILFEGDTLNYPVIVGKLFTGDMDYSSKTDKMANLYVSTKAVLPLNTTIGDYTIQSLIQECMSLFGTHITTEDYEIPHSSLLK